MHAFPSDSKNTTEARLRVAAQFIEQNAALHLDEQQLLQRCTAALMSRFDVSQRTATNDAIHALAAHQMVSTPAFVDVRSSTSAVVYVVNPRTGQMIGFTASELITLADEHRTTSFTIHAKLRCGRRADF